VRKWRQNDIGRGMVGTKWWWTGGGEEWYPESGSGGRSRPGRAHVPSVQLAQGPEFGGPQKKIVGPYTCIGKKIGMKVENVPGPCNVRTRTEDSSRLPNPDRVGCTRRHR
jgi:hypothetical protein